MKMVTTKKALELLAERGIAVSYPTIAQWVRESRFEGAQLEETERGPVWRIPVESVRKFEPPKAGRPAQPADTTRAMNTAFKQAAETSSPTARKRSTAKASASNGTSGKRRKGGKK